MTTTAARPIGVFALLRAAGSLEGFVEGKLDGIGLSIPKLAALQRLCDAGGMLPFGQLAERLACVKSNVTQLVERLESDGLVSRETDPSDKRSRLAVLTDAGRKAQAQGARVQREAEQELFAPLSDDDREHLTAIIEKLRSAAKSRC